MVMQIIFNISGKAITEMIPQLGKFTEKVEDIAFERRAAHFISSILFVVQTNSNIPCLFVFIRFWMQV